MCDKAGEKKNHESMKATFQRFQVSRKIYPAARQLCKPTFINKTSCYQYLQC